MSNQFRFFDNVDLGGFEIVTSDMFKFERPPAMTIFLNEISFTKEAHQNLQNCESVQILVNSETKTILVRSAPSNEPNSIRWDNKVKETYVPRFSCPKLTRPLYYKWNWNTDYRYRTEGRLVKLDRTPVLLFDFKQAKAYNGREVKNKNES